MGLLYASLLISLFAAFVGMLGKQWVSRYLRSTSGSVIVRCRDRQRKFDGIEKWPFRTFIESLPIMLQAALLFLACGLSRYMWSVNTSIARVITSFTALGFLFYIVIVVAGTSSYECPFQTPASTALREIRDSERTRKLLSSLSPPNVINATRRNARRLLASLYLPNTVSIVYAIWMDVRQALVSAFHPSHNFMRPPSSRGISLRGFLSGVRCAVTTIGRQAAGLLPRLNQLLGKAKHRLAQVVRGFGHAVLLPVTAEDIRDQPPGSHNVPGLRVRVWSLDRVREQNRDDACCVSWILRNITDPEAVDSAVRLAANIRWFDGNSDYDPPLDFITNAFETCFDSNRQLYPAMEDRAYSSAQAILRINAGARAQSHQSASKYQIPEIFSSPFPYTNPDLHHAISTLNRNLSEPTLDFPMARAGNHAHLLWMSNVFLDLAHGVPNPRLGSYRSYLSAAVFNDRAVIANILLVWYMILGGRVKAETLWVLNKSYAMPYCFSVSTRSELCTPANRWR